MCYKLDLVLRCSNSSKNLQIDVYLSMLKVNGKFIRLGLPEEPFIVEAQSSFVKCGCSLEPSHLGNRQKMI